MEQIEVKQISGYLPFQLKCQYLGIINGSEISKNRREYEKENTPHINWSYYEEIPPDYGLKIGYLKEIKIFKDYWKCFIGIKHTGLKSFYNGTNFKPVFRPLSDIGDSQFTKLWINEVDAESILKFIECDTETKQSFKFSLEFWEGLYEHHFDIHGLIEKGLAIDINTLNHG